MHLRAVAGIVLCVCLALPAAAEPMMGASVSAPMRHDIDAFCAPLDRAAESSKLIYPINARYYHGEDATGTFAHVLARGGKIVAVYLYTTETQVHGEIVTHDCYRSGRLARMRTEYQRASNTWTRTKYYGDDGSFMTQTDTHEPAGQPGSSPKDEPIYRTPAALPFYKAYLAHRHR